MALWKTLLANDAQQFENMSIQQVVALCGQGRLSDSSTTSSELRDYLRVAKSSNLLQYIDSCLQSSFEKSGFVLQDIVNELGRRLGYQVENGLYQGRTNATGFDGIWMTSKGHSLVVEVKTTDVYRINLDVIAGYREELLEAQRITRNSSMLLVVGRQDTGDFEAQVRGSKHAWNFRIISVDALMKLVLLKERTEEAASSKIYDLLTPFEYTRLDRLIDIAFTVAEDASSPLEEESSEINESISSEQVYAQQHTPASTIDEIRESILNQVSKEYGPFVKESRALYFTPNKEARVVITVSKMYSAGNYWYAYHPSWDEFLQKGNVGFFILGGVGLKIAFAIPREWIHKRLGELNKTEKPNGKTYFHIHLWPGEDNHWHLRLRNGQTESLQEFSFMLP
jgi:hypothetical protein